MIVEKNNLNILDLFDEHKLVKICAPMVRYSKLQFRSLVRNYNCDLCYTPMILADSFRQSIKCRNNEFSTSTNDAPLVTQFAANTVNDFVCSAKLVAPYCNGVDLNCGCPQRWAKQMGVGCIMLEKPDHISDIIQQCRNQIDKAFTVSVKMRILKDVKKTVEICRQLEKCGASYLTIHSRTPSQLKGMINLEVLRLITENVSCPVVANGGIKTLQDCHDLQNETNCKGVMVANGLLTNPMLFSGSHETTIHCIQEWVDICFNSSLDLNDYTNKYTTATISNKPNNLTFQCFHHHLVFMLEKVLPKLKRRVFNNLQNFDDVLLFLKEEFEIIPQLFATDRFKANQVFKLPQSPCTVQENVVETYDYESNEGNYFKTKLVDDDDNEDNDDDCGLQDIFFEN